VPAYLTDIGPITNHMNNYAGPSYLRLGATVLKSTNYNSFRNVVKGEGATVLVLGSLLQNVLDIKQDIDLWVVTEIPFEAPKAFYESILKTKKLLVIEETSGILGQIVAKDLIVKKISVSLIHLFGKGYPSKLYGSQEFHIKENGLDLKNISETIDKLINE
jgi:hypothetical protein